MERHMHEHGPLYTSVPLLMFGEGGGVVVWRHCAWACTVGVKSRSV